MQICFLSSQCIVSVNSWNFFIPRTQIKQLTIVPTDAVGKKKSKSIKQKLNNMYVYVYIYIAVWNFSFPQVSVYFLWILLFNTQQKKHVHVDNTVLSAPLNTTQSRSWFPGAAQWMHICPGPLNLSLPCLTSASHFFTML